MKLKFIISLIILGLSVFTVYNYCQYRSLQNSRFKASLNILGSKMLMYVNEYNSTDFQIDKLIGFIRETSGNYSDEMNLLKYLEKEKSNIRFKQNHESSTVTIYNIGPDKADDLLEKSRLTYFQLNFFQYIFSFKGDIILTWIEYTPPCTKLLQRQWDEYYKNGERVTNEIAFNSKNLIVERINDSLINVDSAPVGIYTKALVMRFNENKKWQGEIECRIPYDNRFGEDLILSNFIDSYTHQHFEKEIDSAVVMLKIDIQP